MDIGGVSVNFFKVDGVIYAMKPTDKKDVTKMLCVRVENPVTIRSANGSITGNCARGVQKEYIEFISRLNSAQLSFEEIFRHIVLS